MDYLEVKSEDTTYFVKKPGVKDYRDAQIVYNKAFRKALEGGAILKRKLNDFIAEQGLWDDHKETKYKALLDKIKELEAVLGGGGISLKKAKEAALDLRRTRNELQELIAERNSYESNCAEGQADNEKFNYLVSVCVLKSDKSTKVWDSMDAYDADAIKPWAIECATKLAGMLYGLDPNYEKNLVENKFLLDYKFANKDYDLVNKDGHLVDVDGRLIDEEGYYIKYVDGVKVKVNKDGQELDENGRVKVEFKPFLDDDGNPVVDEPTVETTPVTSE